MSQNPPFPDERPDATMAIPVAEHARLVKENAALLQDTKHLQDLADVLEKGFVLAAGLNKHYDGEDGPFAGMEDGQRKRVFGEYYDEDADPQDAYDAAIEACEDALEKEKRRKKLKKSNESPFVIDVPRLVKPSAKECTVIPDEDFPIQDGNNEFTKEEWMEHTRTYVNKIEPGPPIAWLVALGPTYDFINDDRRAALREVYARG
jgi:hypothetical protein